MIYKAQFLDVLPRDPYIVPDTGSGNHLTDALYSGAHALCFSYGRVVIVLGVSVHILLPNGTVSAKMAHGYIIL